MAFELQPLKKEDAPRCASIYFDAFQNPHSLGCWPRTPSIRQFWENMICDELEESGSHWLKAVSTSTGEIAGFAKWQQPKPGVAPEVDLPTWPDDADKALCDETFGAWARAHRDLMGTRGHWCKLCFDADFRFNTLMRFLDCEIVATDPKYQGKGAGSQLMRWGLRHADEQGVEAFLEASPDAVPLYERLGFREADRTDTFIKNERVDGVWYRNLFMTRPIQATASNQ